MRAWLFIDNINRGFGSTRGGAANDRWSSGRAAVLGLGRRVNEGCAPAHLRFYSTRKGVHMTIHRPLVPSCRRVLLHTLHAVLTSILLVYVEPWNLADYLSANSGTQARTSHGQINAALDDTYTPSSPHIDALRQPWPLLPARANHGVAWSRRSGARR